MSSRTPSLPKGQSEKRRFWQRHVRRQAKGKLTQRAYCERHQLGYPSFVRWRRVLNTPEKSQTTAIDSGGFVPVHIQPSSEEIVSAFPVRSDAVDLVLPNGVRIEGITAANVELVARLAARL